MKKLTVICREEGYPNDILIYTIEANPNSERAVQTAVQAERVRDLGNEAREMEILFAFAGDLQPAADWRE